MAFSVVDAGEIEARNGVFKPLRQALGVSAFGINQLELPPNAEGPEHDHSGDGQEEVYAVVRGSGTVKIGDEEHELRPGVFVFTSPDQSRQMRAGPDGLAWIGIGSQPGGFTPRQ
jgi:quercetin dioxygenase-like cupin family protein